MFRALNATDDAMFIFDTASLRARSSTRERFGWSATAETSC